MVTVSKLHVTSEFLATDGLPSVRTIPSLEWAILLAAVCWLSTLLNIPILMQFFGL